MNEALDQLAQAMLRILLLGGSAFIMAMILTPVYTYFAYRYKFWKAKDRHARRQGARSHLKIACTQDRASHPDHGWPSVCDRHRGDDVDI